LGLPRQEKKGSPFFEKERIMSFVTNQVTYNGIIMTGDRRALAYPAVNGNPDLNTAPKKGVVQKVYATKNNIGISLFGQGSVNGYTIERYMYDFLSVLDVEKYKTPFEVAQQLKGYFRMLDSYLETIFHVGGYDETNGKTVPKLWTVYIKENRVDLVNNNDILSGSMILGSNDFINDFLKQQGGWYKQLNVQDLVEFAVFLTDTARQIKHFSGQDENVSEEMDILIIYPDHHEWLDKAGRRLNG
jgi:hypothetical protein